MAVDRPDSGLETLLSQLDARMGRTPISGLNPARPDSQTRGSRSQENFLVFLLQGKIYAVSLANVVEIGEPPEITPVPNLPDWLSGVANLRGEILSIVDLHLFLGLPAARYPRNRKMVVFRDSEREVSAGFIVDRIRGTLQIPAAAISMTAAPFEEKARPYLRGLHEQRGEITAVLEIDRLLRSRTFNFMD